MTVAVSSAARRPALPAASPVIRRAALLGVVAVAILAGVYATSPAATAEATTAAGADLTRLLRGMAGLKFLMAGAATAAVLWRLALPVTAPWFALYAAACAAMAAGPCVIAGMAHVFTGAALVHTGLAAALVLLWRDPAVGLRLAGVLATRRR